MRTTSSPTDQLARRYPLGAAVRLAELDVDPYPTLAALREQEPVAWVPETRMWFVTRRAEVLTVLRDASRFTTDAERSTIRDIFGRHMMTTDGETALRYKRSCLHAFRADVLAERMRPWIDTRVATALGETTEQRSFDLIRDVAGPLARESALRVLGLPLELSGRLADWYADFARALANFTHDPEVRLRGKQAAMAFADAVRPTLATLSTSDRGLLAHLATATEDRFTDDEIISNALIILFGGIETTESMIANTVWTLLSTESWGVVGDDRARGDAIEEAFRWQPAVQSITRHCTTDVVLAGQPLPAGAVVQCMIGAANRDPRHFRDPDRFLPDRHNASDHLSLGTGRHLCLGAHLARMEIDAVLVALSARFPTLMFEDGAPPPLRGYEFRRPTSLRLTGHPA